MTATSAASSRPKVVWLSQSRSSPPFNGDAGWSHHGDAEQVELAKRLDEAEDKLNDRQFAALELMRERWAQGFEISQADLDEVKEFKAVDRNNRRRILDQLTSVGSWPPPVRCPPKKVG